MGEYEEPPGPSPDTRVCTWEPRQGRRRPRRSCSLSTIRRWSNHGGYCKHPRHGLDSAVIPRDRAVRRRHRGSKYEGGGSMRMRLHRLPPPKPAPSRWHGALPWWIGRGGGSRHPLLTAADPAPPRSTPAGPRPHRPPGRGSGPGSSRTGGPGHPLRVMTAGRRRRNTSWITISTEEFEQAKGKCSASRCQPLQCSETSARPSRSDRRPGLVRSRASECKELSALARPRAIPAGVRVGEL
jgi:hypothetical protein